MELTDWGTIDRAIKILKSVQVDLGNVLTATHPSEVGPLYISEIEAVESHMRAMWVESEWVDELLTARYWQIRHLQSSSIRPYPLVEAEVRHQVSRLAHPQRSAWTRLVSLQLLRQTDERRAGG